MIRRILLIAVVLVALALIGNAVRGDDEPGEVAPTDSAASETIADVRDALTNAGIGGVQIEATSDTVTLYGTVATPLDSTVAETITRSVVGVDVTIDNQLTAETAVEGETVGPAAATSDDLALQNRLSTLLAHNPIIFESASAEIAADSLPALDLLVAELGAAPDVSVVIAGHTDSDGEEQANLELSQARADAVLAHLVGAGIDGNRLTAQGFGESAPIADNVSQEGKAQNRRIEVVVQPS